MCRGLMTGSPSGPASLFHVSDEERGEEAVLWLGGGVNRRPVGSVRPKNTPGVSNRPNTNNVYCMQTIVNANPIPIVPYARNARRHHEAQPPVPRLQLLRRLIGEHRPHGLKAADGRGAMTCCGWGAALL